MFQVQQTRDGKVENFVCVPISCDLYNEFSLRCDRSVDPSSWIENIIRDYLERTEGDAGIWSERHAREVDFDEKIQGLLDSIGPPDQGYQWKNVLLRNGSRIRMTYKGEDYFAFIGNGQLLYNEESMSPSQFAAAVAEGSSRNAWRDLWIQDRQHEGDSGWERADRIRSRLKSRKGRSND
jgi:hypothetical protein